jgi:TetR/AcrR family acrAB operon transcriptional repressor
MPRRTKEQALATRSALLDAAEQLFLDQGVSRTTLQDVAMAAGVTRGAVYWHFADKGALFNAMLERVLLPLEAADALFEPAGSGLPPLQGLQQHLHDVFARALDNPQARRVYAIVLHRIEYVGEMGVVLARLQQARAGHVALIEQALAKAGVNAGRRRAQALGLHAVVSGLFETWLLEGETFDLLPAADTAVGTYLLGVTAQLRA